MHPVSDSIAGRIVETHEIGTSGLATNAGLLLIYVALDLTIFQLVFVYWWEALWIGPFSGLKLITASLFDSPYERSKWAIRRS